MELNSVSREQLSTILTAKLTDRLLEERQHGEFTSWDDLHFRMRGLGQKKLNGLRKAGFRVNNEMASEPDGSCDEAGKESATRMELSRATRMHLEEALSPTMASKVLSARVERDFSSWKDLRSRVPGLGTKKVSQLRELFSIPKPGGLEEDGYEP